MVFFTMPIGRIGASRQGTKCKVFQRMVYSTICETVQFMEQETQLLSHLQRRW